MLRIIGSLLFYCLCLTAYADIRQPDTLRLAYGMGEPNDLRGGRIALGWDWPHALLSGNQWQLTGYWDLSAAYFRVKPACHRCQQLWTVAIAPVFRWQVQFEQLVPYLEASVGLAGLSTLHLGYRNLGAHWSFQDLLGAGVRFGEHQQYDISYHYLHYSNANIVKPNNGVDVKILLSFAYHFA